VSQRGFRLGYSCESQVITVCKGFEDTLDNLGSIGSIIIDFKNAFGLVPHDQLLTKIVISGVVSCLVAWVREFLLGRMHS